MVRVIRRLILALVGVMVISHSVWLYEFGMQAADILARLGAWLAGSGGP